MNKIQRWSKLDNKTQTKPYDLGGILQGAGGMGAGIGTLIGGPVGGVIGGIAGQGVSMIGGLLNNSKKKKEEQALADQQKLQATQAMMNSLPKSGQGLAQSIISYGGYLTPQLLAANGLVVPEGGDGKATTTSGFQPVTTEEDAFAKFMLSQKGDINDPKYQQQMKVAFDKINLQNKPGTTVAKGKPLGIEKSTKPSMSWYPSSAALSQYKMGNKDVVFGHYSSDKYGGANTGTPIKYNDLITLGQNPKYKDILPKDYDALLQGVGYNQNQVVQNDKGGFVNPLAMPNNGLYSYKGGGTHSQNPLGGIPLGKNIQGKQNSVESKESSFVFPEGKYIFSNRLKLKK